MLHRPVTNSRRPPRLPQRRPTSPRTRHRAHRSVYTPPAPPLGMQKASRAPSAFIVLTAVHRLARVSTTERARTMGHATPRRSPAPGRRGRDARGRQRAAVAHEECATRYIYSVQAMPTWHKDLAKVGENGPPKKGKWGDSRVLENMGSDLGCRPRYSPAL